MQISLGGGFSCDLDIGPEGLCPGIGAFVWLGTALRDPRLPWTVAFESEDGLFFTLSRFLQVLTSGDETTLVFAADGRWMPRIQEADAMGDARIRTRRISAAQATVRWTFRPITETVADDVWQGLAMRISVDSPGHPLHWLIEDTTWEIGGTATGCTLIQQDVSTIQLEQVVTPGSCFSTIEKFVTDGWGGSFPMDMLPRCAGSSPCDFMARDDLALCIFSERPSLSRSRIEKFADEEVIHFTERPFFALTATASAPERKLLVHRSAVAMPRHAVRNLWLDCFTHVRSRIHATYGFTLETPRPLVHAHLWDAEFKTYGPRWTEALAASLPLYSSLGYREVFTHGVWESVTSDPTRGPADGNICAPYRFRFADEFGGDVVMRELGARAAAVGIGLFQWYSFHLSKFARVWHDHPDWMMREANGDPYDAGYGILVAGRLNSPYGQWFEDDIRHSCTAAGSAGIFWDSYQNLGLTAVDWGSPDKAPQAEAIWAMQVRQQAAGLRHRPEIVTIFGVSHVAMFGFAADRFRRRLWEDVVSGDQAFALLDTAPAFFSQGYPFGSSGLDAARYFWLAAHRCLPGIPAHPWASSGAADSASSRLPAADQVEAFGRVNRLFNRCESLLHRLRLTPDGDHVRWLDSTGALAVVWSFRSGSMPCDLLSRDLETGTRADAGGRLEFAAERVYLIGDRHLDFSI